MYAAYEPFRREALHCFLLNLLLFSIFGALLLAVSLKSRIKVHEINLLLISIPIFVFEIHLFCTVYRIAILSWIEMAGKVFVTQSLILEEIKEESSPSGRWGSIIPQLYPKKANYGRYKILCRTEEGKRFKLRCAVNGKNYQIIGNQIWDGPGWKRSVTYGRFSHVILRYNDKDDISFILSRRLEIEPKEKREKHPHHRGKGMK